MKKITFLTLLLASMLMVGGCNNGGGQDPSSTSSSQEPLQVFEEADYSHLSEETKQIEKVRFHYHRNEKAYDNYQNYYHWQIWAWNMAGGNGQAYTFDHKENYGVYVDVPLANYSDPVEKLGFLVAITATWQKDPEADRSIDVTGQAPGGILDIYVKTMSDKIYYSEQSALDNSLVRALLDANSNKNVELRFSIQNEPFAFDENKLSILVNDEKMTDYTVAFESPLANITAPGGFDITKKIEFVYKFSEEWTDKVILFFGDYYDSQEFIDNFAYDGELGAILDNEENPTKTTFKVWSPVSQEITLNLYQTGDYMTDKEPLEQLKMTKGEKGVWSVLVNEDLSGKYYTYTVKNSAGENEVVDPYALSAGVNGKRGMVTNFAKINKEIEGWDDDIAPNYGNTGVDASIYEIHVRDMTINPNSNVSKENRGKFLGLTEENTKYTNGAGVEVSTGLAHLKELGVTHVQIQPFYDFSSVDEDSKTLGEMTDEVTNKLVSNYNWGYDPQNYNVLEGSYSTNPHDGAVRIKEFKQMVMALHKAGLNITMDVVYNHTSSTEQSNFQQLVPFYYYRTDKFGAFYNGSGCGNEISSERYMTRKYIRNSVKMWTEEYHLSGFRFDLMGLIDNQTMIDVYNDVTAINPKALVYGEPWTGMSATKLKDGVDPNNLDHQKTVQASLSQSFFAGNNALVGAFHDGIRNAIRGENGAGSKGFVQGSSIVSSLKYGIKGDFGNDTNLDPEQAIIYASCHDNYTLYDQLIQSAKDSASFNQMYLQAEAIIFTSQGVPFIQEGEDFMRSKDYLKDGKVAYCDNSYNVGDMINDMDYDVKASHVETFNHMKDLIALRKSLSNLWLSDRTMIKNGVVFDTSLETNGVLGYKINDMLFVYHANKAQSAAINVRGEVLFDTYNELEGQDVTSVTLKANQSVIIRK